MRWIRQRRKDSGEERKKQFKRSSQQAAEEPAVTQKGECTTRTRPQPCAVTPAAALGAFGVKGQPSSARSSHAAPI